MDEDPADRSRRIMSEARLNIAKADASLVAAERRAATWAEYADIRATLAAGPVQAPTAPSSAAIPHAGFTLDDVVQAVGIRLRDLRQEATDAIGQAIAVERRRHKAELRKAIATLRAEIVAAPPKSKTSRRRENTKHASLPAEVADLRARRRGAA